jgi:ATP-dependent Clp protease ATP-binding subunit ClpX
MEHDDRNPSEDQELTVDMDTAEVLDDRPSEEDRFLPTVEFRAWVDSLPGLTPREIVARLRELGYLGQDRAVRAVALAAHRHIRRVKSLFVEQVPRSELPAKHNLLMVGPTGCGKTYLMELLFCQVLGIPTATVDVTAYSETGYIGEDVNSIITRLLFAAEGDPLRTKIGMICLDEFDKIASSNNRAVFAGEGTTKDVSGMGVQRELLKMLESSVVAVPTEFGHSSYQEKPLLSTADIMFVACGAFSGLKSLSNKRLGGGIGFHAKPRNAWDEIAVEYEQSEMEDTVIFQQYGFLPELIGRFSRIVPFAPLPRDTLMQILRQNVLRTYSLEFSLAGIRLDVEEPVLDRIVDEAMRKQTGARGLRSAITLHMEDAAFEAYSAPQAARILVAWQEGAVKTRVETASGESIGQVGP